MIDFVGKRTWYFLLSALVIIPGIISLIFFRLEPGIDFKGGSVATFSFQEEVALGALRAELIDLGYGDDVRRLGEGGFLVRTPPLQGDEGRIIDAFESEFGAFAKEPKFDSVSAGVAQERVLYAFYALLAASGAILLYISWAFRKIPKPFRYGVCAILALMHDVLVVLGLFSIMGAVFKVEVNAMFITGLLTVIGYSVHDTIVVFDRIRENMSKSVVYQFETTVNNSLLETLGRSVNTSLTTLIVLVALLLFSGGAIFTLLLVFLIGVITGTYSSMFVASQLLVIWEKRDIGRFFKKIPLLQSLARK